MGKLLFIGSTVADVIIRIPFLPSTGQDLHVLHQSVSLGGCAYNAYSASRLFHADSILFSPCGSGVWGDWVYHSLTEKGIQSPIPRTGEPNGCCYCFVEESGERTFISDHGAQYRFLPEWFELLGAEEFDAVYLCGLEAQESTGGIILDYLESHPPKLLCFAPGPRICRIPPEIMARIFAFHPLLHINQQEALDFTGAADVEEAVWMIHKVTGGNVIITLGADGALTFQNGQIVYTDACPTFVTDTIGAGDSHIGAVMAGLSQGFSLAEASAKANLLSAAVVSCEGATINADYWAKWQQKQKEGLI